MMTPIMQVTVVILVAVQPKASANDIVTTFEIVSGSTYSYVSSQDQVCSGRGCLFNISGDFTLVETEIGQHAYLRDVSVELSGNEEVVGLPILATGGGVEAWLTSLSLVWGADVDCDGYCVVYDSESLSHDFELSAFGDWSFQGTPLDGAWLRGGEDNQLTGGETIRLFVNAIAIPEPSTMVFAASSVFVSIAEAFRRISHSK